MDYPGVWPAKWPNGDPTTSNLADCIGEVMFPLTVRYNAGLIAQVLSEHPIPGDTTSPAVTLNGTFSADSANAVTKSSTFTASASASDLQSGIIPNKYGFNTWRKSGSNWVDGRYWGPCDGATSIGSLAVGTYRIEALARNWAGLTGSSGYRYFKVDVGDQPPGAATYLSMQGLQWTELNGNRDGYPGIGEQCRLKVRLRNASGLGVINVGGVLSTSVGGVEIAHNDSIWGDLANGEDGWSGPGFEVNFSLPAERAVSFLLHVTYVRNGTLYYQDFSFSETIYDPNTSRPRPALDHVDVSVVRGDGDAKYEGGERFDINVYIKNVGEIDAHDVEVQLSDVRAGATQLSFNTGWLSYPDIAVGAAQKQYGSGWDIGSMPFSAAGPITGDVSFRCEGFTEQTINDCLLFSVEAAAWLAVRPDSVNFGLHSTASTVTADTMVTNPGGLPLVITGAVASHPDTTWSGGAFPWTIPAQSSKPVTVSFNPTGLQGEVSRTVTFFTSNGHLYDPESAQFVLNGMVSDTPPASTVPGATSWESLDVSGNMIVWRDAVDNGLDAYDVAKSEVIPICTNPSSHPTYAHISGNIVAWSDARNGGDLMRDIYAYDITTQTEFAVSTDPAYERLVGVDNGKIAFTRVYHHYPEDELHNGPDPENLFVYDVESKATTQITSWVRSGYSNMMTISYNNCDFGGGDTHLVRTWTLLEYIRI